MRIFEKCQVFVSGITILAFLLLIPQIVARENSVFTFVVGMIFFLGVVLHFVLELVIEDIELSQIVDDDVI